MKIQYLVTERAHLMCPQMNFGLAVTIKTKYNKKRAQEVMKQLESAHPFLKSRIGYEKETNKYFYLADDLVTTPIVEKKITTWDTNGFPDALWEDYKMSTSTDWNVMTNGLLQLFIYNSQDKFSLLFIAHHLLCDGRGLLELVQSFVDCYLNHTIPTYSEEQLISDITDLPKGSNLPFISKAIINSMNKKWRKENKHLSYEEYHEIADKFTSNNKKQYSLLQMKDEEFMKILRECHDNKITVNDYLLAKMVIENQAEKIIMAIDIRNLLNNYVKGSLGNYATAVGIHCKTKNTNLLKVAKMFHQKKEGVIKNKHKLMTVLACYMQMEPGLLDASAIAGLGLYESEPAKFTGGTLFGYTNRNGYSITNLGKIDHPLIEKGIFIPPASPAIKKIWGVLTVNNVLTICSCDNL
jgi:hypothetical protein